MAKIVSLSEAGSIAIHSMVMIAQAEEILNVIKIADATNSSKHHIAKVLQRLVKEGYLTSTRGPKGGFLLKKSPKDVNLLEIYEAIEGKIEIGDCPMGYAKCPFDKCLMENVIKDMTNQFISFFNNKTLADYM
ncbi:MAG: Rrf2 family transcriptional regulator [Bacteroidales bacterium]|nr:Rrf2 family transcriptional regulator [Bacteroidales bacterium]